MQALRTFHDTQDSIREMMSKIEENISKEDPAIGLIYGENRKARRAREKQERREQKVKAKA